MEAREPCLAPLATALSGDAHALPTPGNRDAVEAAPMLQGDRANTTESSSGGETQDGDGDNATKRPPMRNPSRERKRAELTALRQEAVALERERNLLLLKRKHQKIHSSDDGIWKQTAETERLTRERAESENERLAAMLQQQIGLSRSLETLLRKRARSESDTDTHRPPPSRLCSDASVSMLHAQFTRDILRIYKSGDICRIFSGTDWTAASGELGRSVVREEKIDPITNTRVVEMRETRHVPFEYQRVVDAMWRCAQHPFAEQNRLIESYETPENQIALKYRAATPGNQHRGDLLTAVMVLQKFDEPDRTVQVWRIMSSSTKECATQAQRAFSDETGWIIIEPVPEGVHGMEPGTAVVRLVAQLVPLWPHGHGPDDPSSKLKADDFHDLVVEASCEDVVALGDAVGSLLLDESLGLASDLVL